MLNDDDDNVDEEKADQVTQWDPDVFFTHENTNEQVNGSQLDNSTTLLMNKSMRDQSYIGGVDGCQNLALVEHNQILAAGYIELNCFLENLDQNQPNNDSSVDCVEGAYNEKFLIGIDEHGDLPEIDVDELFDMLKENDNVQELFRMPPIEKNYVPQPNYINFVSALAAEYPYGAVKSVEQNSKATLPGPRSIIGWSLVLVSPLGFPLAAIAPAAGCMMADIQPSIHATKYMIKKTLWKPSSRILENNGINASNSPFGYSDMLPGKVESVWKILNVSCQCC
ncbi:hypothetical protein J5N97_000633 [Dioscorea zingiberensis]|uniref:Uncharacterized protein n=1 Tax=Dioscorea zingiberensis TaxID=325984 RepID=A0A9D5BVD8_9LILI|nr:hypothetical protein J5N97_000633 [Dioscorea zingiberensis]